MPCEGHYRDLSSSSLQEFLASFLGAWRCLLGASQTGDEERVFTAQTRSSLRGQGTEEIYELGLMTAEW